ncbi:hypothetical protein BOX15_Mlig024814g3 [Macrostomum lignano]|uniref:MYND-type domain-containing protein n=1 Tax=Macrostomum lignano TaxID=282301 RepID=A0A267FJW7_9PLAT|nr:hypothetical protein BOX15_Mlig024814g3 [Macrostomum lignano]
MAVSLPVTFEPQSAMSLSSLVTSIEYKTGALYDGDVSDQAKQGTGVFTWPNGDTYSGEFSNDKRNGKGEQVWYDGDRYNGEYVDDMRHGFGEYTWNNGERYIGQFYKDHRHGPGQYTWADGSSFVGTYYMDRKEGYGTFFYANGDKFDGLYQADEREGPGVITYADGSQDVGLWHRERLSRLLTEVPDTFSLGNHPELDYDPSRGKVQLPAEGRPDPQLDAFLEAIVNPPPEWTYDPAAAQRVKSRLDGEVLTGSRPDSAAFNRKDSDVNFRRSAGLREDAEHTDEADAAGKETPAAETEQQDASSLPPSSNQSPTHQQHQHRASPKKAGGSSPSRSPKRGSPSRRPQPTVKPAKRGGRSTVETPNESSNSPTADAEAAAKKSQTVDAWNPTPASVAMQLHVIRFRQLQSRAGFDVDAVLRADRSGFCQQGPLERRSVELIEAAKSGDLAAVRGLLSSGDVDPNVSDSLGKTPLLCASVNWHRQVVDYLLDAGADVNRLSDEGVSCLAACFVHYYPSDKFQRNIAESPVKRLTEEEQKAARKAAAKAAAAAAAAASTAAAHRKPGALPPVAEGKPGEAAGRPGASSDRLTDPVVGRGGRFAGTLTGARRPDFVAAAATRPGRFQRSWSVSDDDDDDDGDSNSGARGGQPKQDDAVELASAVSVGSASPRPSEDFESTDSLANYKITVPEELVRRAATALSSNQLVASRVASSMVTRTAPQPPGGGDENLESGGQEGRTREMAVHMAKHKLMSDTVHLLLERGADPNASAVPFPALFFAVKSGDVDMTRQLLLRGADVRARLEASRGGLTALHIAVALPGEPSVTITELLLHSLAYPDARAVPDDSFLDRTMEEDWSRDEITDEQKMLLGGRTPLQIAASREDEHRRAHQIVRLLLEHKANPNLLCNGNNALTLAVQSGNDAAIDELLAHNANVNLALSHGVGSALCAASNIAYEDKRQLRGRLDLIDKLMDAGADILQPIAIGVKRQLGTAVDYGWQSYYLDKRVAFSPYHALNPVERQAFQDRNVVLKHLSNRLREKAVERERRRLEEEEADGVVSRGPSENFVYTGAGASMPGTRDSGDEFLRQQEVIVRRPIFKYCYDCGRSVGVRLTPCTRCKEVYFCGKACKVRAWNDRHKDECQRVGGGAGAAGRKTDASRIDSPTPATDADRGLSKPRVRDLSKHLAELRMRNPMKGRSKSAVGAGVGGARDFSPTHGGGKLPPIKGQHQQQLLMQQQQQRALLNRKLQQQGGKAGNGTAAGGSSLPEGVSYKYSNGRYILVDSLGRPLKGPYYQQLMMTGIGSDGSLPDNYSFE